ncbi:MAG: metallophosphoesterase [Magnetococcales bacterium]|nr:metallophosphoesterase [Magnetococcales bacterium]
MSDHPSADHGDWQGLSILHLSDLHFGEHCRFAEMMGPAELGERTAASVQEVLPKNQRLDLVIVTGDLTEEARTCEYEQAFSFLDALAGGAGINRDQFVLLPGNHDVSRKISQSIQLDLEDQRIFPEDIFRQRVETEKFKNFEAFLALFMVNQNHIQRLERGGSIWNFPRLRLSVAALNSCEQITHRPNETRGQLSAQQVEQVLKHWGEDSERLKILALHHNPSGVPQQSIEGWNTYINEKNTLSKEQIACILDDARGFQDKERVQSLVCQCHPQLLLYGHQHAGSENEPWLWNKDGQTFLLGAGSLGVVGNNLPKDFPNACQLIIITVDGKMKVIPLEYDPRASVPGKADPGRFTPRGTDADHPNRTLCLPQGWTEKQPPVSEQAAPRRTAFLTAYRQRFTDARPRWDLSHTGVALAMGFKPEQAALNDMYLPLRLGEKDDPDALDLGAVLSSGEVVNLTQPMIIRGQAGAGKTTWIRWTFHQLLQLNHTLPIKIELRSLASYWERVPWEQSSVEGYLEDWMKNEYRMGGWYDELMAFLEHPGSVRPVLLIDGWDELGDLGHDFRDKLRKFLNTHPSVRCVVTSRPYGAGRPTGGDGFAERVIQPLNKGEIQELVTKFFRHAVDSPDTARNIDEFIAALERSEKAGEMARTALLLTLMLLISRTAPLPEKRVDLFEQCVKTMIGTMPDKRKEQGAKRRAEAWAPDDPHERIRVTADLAHAIQSDDIEGEKQSFRTAKLLAREKIVQLKWGTGWTVDDKIKFINWLLDSAGIFMDRSDNQLQFIHLSFQEYLTAAYLKANITDTDRPERFVRLAANPSWWETLRLWAALIANENPENLEPVLLRLLDNGKDALFLAGTILADGMGQDSTFSRWLDEFIGKIHEFWSDETFTVLKSWARSRKEERRQPMEANLHQAGKKAQTWMAWIRVDVAVQEAKLSSPPPPESTSELTHWVVQSFFGFSTEVKALAAYRIPAAASPLWSGSIAPWIVFLRLLPGRRSRLGQHLQVIASSEKQYELLKISSSILYDFIEAALDKEKINLAHRVMSHVAPYSTQGWVDDVERYWRSCEKFNKNSFASFWGSDWRHDWVHKRVNYWTNDLVSSWALARAYPIAMELKLDEKNIDHLTGIFGEFYTLSRISPRAILAHETKQLLPLTPPEWQPEMRLFEVACRRSFDPKGDPEPFRDALRQYEQERQNDHPIWPLLAKLIARHIKKGDQEFKELEQIIRNPEQSGLPAPYADAVRYWWRGDLLLLDGSEITLDQLLGIDLPYLEEMPDELDWGG